MLTADGLRHGYRGRVVLDGVDLTLVPGEVVALLGANGAGKSTLLRLLLGLLRPQAGTVRLQGRALADWPRRALARELAYVPQAHTAPFPYTLREIVLLGRLPHGGLMRAPRPADHAAADAALARLQLGGLADRPYTEVSGGERQLALIARALAQGVRMLVLDEPAGGLDYGRQHQLLALLASLAADGCGVLMSTHHPEHALHGAQRVVTLQDGRISADGAPHAVLTRERLSALYGVEVDRVPAYSTASKPSNCGGPR